MDRYDFPHAPPPQRHPGLPPGADPGEHDGLSRLLGPGVSLRDALGLVPLLLGLRLAAEHLLHLYSPVRLLLADGPPSPPPGADELLRRGRGVAGDPGRDAGVPVLHLPQSWYANTLTTALGFPYPGFVSSDYFSLLPWLLLFWTGYHLYRLRPETPALPDIRLPGLMAMGRHSLVIYLLHQPVIYGLLALIFS